MDLMGMVEGFLGGESGGKGIEAGAVQSIVKKLMDGNAKDTGADEGLIHMGSLVSSLGNLSGLNLPEELLSGILGGGKAHKSLDGNSVLSMVEKMAGGGKDETGADEGHVDVMKLLSSIAPMLGK